MRQLFCGTLLISFILLVGMSWAQPWHVYKNCSIEPCLLTVQTYTFAMNGNDDWQAGWRVQASGYKSLRQAQATMCRFASQSNFNSPAIANGMVNCDAVCMGDPDCLLKDDPTADFWVIYRNPESEDGNLCNTYSLIKSGGFGGGGSPGFFVAALRPKILAEEELEWYTMDSFTCSWQQTEIPLTLLPPALGDVSTAPEPNLSLIYDTQHGDIHFGEGYYRVPNQTINADSLTLNENGEWVLSGQWGRTNSNQAGFFEFTFTSECRFVGRYWSTTGTRPSHINWAGTCKE